jgi:hypothetical protein
MGTQSGARNDGTMAEINITPFTAIPPTSRSLLTALHPMDRSSRYSTQRAKPATMTLG